VVAEVVLHIILVHLLQVLVAQVAVALVVVHKVVHPELVHLLVLQTQVVVVEVSVKTQTHFKILAVAVEQVAIVALCQEKVLEAEHLLNQF
jgi:hypothetical protein